MNSLKPLKEPRLRPSLSAQRVDRIAQSTGAKSYLEIGVAKGATFNALRFPRKVAVDPRFQFDPSEFAEDGVTFHNMTSDAYFTTQPREAFDIIFLDGLHTFQQTFRDFCNTLSCAHERTVWLIDDVLPVDVYSSWPNAEESLAFRRRGGGEGSAWHGDVFKLIFMIHDFFPTLSYRTLVGRGNPQAVIWKSARASFAPLLNTVEAVERLDYFELLKKIDVLNSVSEDEMWELLPALWSTATSPAPIKSKPAAAPAPSAVLSPVAAPKVDTPAKDRAASGRKRPKADGAIKPSDSEPAPAAPERIAPPPAAPVRRLRIDPVTFYNPPPERILTPFIDPTIQPQIESVDYSFLSQLETIRSRDGVPFASPAQWFSRFGVYDQEGKIVPEVTRFSRITPEKFDMPARMDRDRMRAAPRVDGVTIYLGRLHGHFGHFLVESLARAWALLKVGKDVKVVFHYANFPSADFPMDWSKIRFPSFVNEIFGLLGLDWSRILLANRDLSFERLLVPHAQFWIEDAAGAGMCAVYDHICEQAEKRLPDAKGWGEKVYLTRRSLVSEDPRKASKSIANEREVEEMFASRGFNIVAPEKYSLSEQILAISKATHIAGSTGSALHNAVFSARPNANLIAIDTRFSRTQFIIDAARGLNAYHIFCPKGRDGTGAQMVDPPTIRTALEEIL